MLKCSTGAAAVASLPDGHMLKCLTGAAAVASLSDVLAQGPLVVIRRCLVLHCLGGPALRPVVWCSIARRFARSEVLVHHVSIRLVRDVVEL